MSESSSCFATYMPHAFRAWQEPTKDGACPDRALQHLIRVVSIFVGGIFDIITLPCICFCSARNVSNEEGEGSAVNKKVGEAASGAGIREKGKEKVSFAEPEESSLSLNPLPSSSSADPSSDVLDRIASVKEQCMSLIHGHQAQIEKLEGIVSEHLPAQINKEKARVDSVFKEMSQYKEELAALRGEFEKLRSSVQKYETLESRVAQLETQAAQDKALAEKQIVQWKAEIGEQMQGVGPKIDAIDPKIQSAISTLDEKVKGSMETLKTDMTAEFDRKLADHHGVIYTLLHRHSRPSVTADPVSDPSEAESSKEGKKKKHFSAINLIAKGLQSDANPFISPATEVKPRSSTPEPHGTHYLELPLGKKKKEKTDKIESSDSTEVVSEKKPKEKPENV